mmetsp:Transcript_37857/g.52570  ORF Transcript_37857/g.52570 Transcript_37857/m.52570 type:complete len:278 (-) Transcript_37857:2-835(-)
MFSCQTVISAASRQSLYIPPSINDRNYFRKSGLSFPATLKHVGSPATMTAICHALTYKTTCVSDSTPEVQARPLTHFQKLVSSQRATLPIVSKFIDDEAADLDKFWRKEGVREEVHRRALVDANLKVFKNGTPLPLLMQLMKLRIQRLQVLLPGIDVAKMLWKEPRLLEVDLVESCRRLVDLHNALPGINLPLMVRQEPSLVVRADVVELVTKSLARLQTLLPRVDTLRMVKEHPSILFTDVECGIKRLKELKSSHEIDKMVESNPMLLLKWSNNKN